MKTVLFLVWFVEGKHIVMRQKEMPVMASDIEWVCRQFSEVNKDGYCEAYADDKLIAKYGKRPEEPK